MFESIKRIFGGKPRQDALTGGTALVIDCAAMNTANLIIDKFISDRHGTKDRHWTRGIESYLSRPGIAPNSIRQVSVRLPSGSVTYYFNVARAAKVADMFVESILDSIDWDQPMDDDDVQSSAASPADDEIPFEEGPGSFGESVDSLIYQYQSLSGDNRTRTATLFDRRVDLFAATSPDSEYARLYAAIRAGAISSLSPHTMADVVEKAALQTPMFFTDLLRLVARVEYDVRAGDETFEPIYRYIDKTTKKHGISDYS